MVAVRDFHEDIEAQVSTRRLSVNQPRQVVRERRSRALSDLAPGRRAVVEGHVYLPPVDLHVDLDGVRMRGSMGIALHGSSPFRPVGPAGSGNDCRGSGVRPTSCLPMFFVGRSSLLRHILIASMTLRADSTSDEYASDAEVEAALRGLTAAQTLRLSQVAEFRARAVATLGLGLSGDDLLQEAIGRTLSGDRRWRKSKVGFERHLRETIRSIVSHAPDEFRGGLPTLSDPHDEGEALLGRPPTAERIAAAREALAKIEAKFADDDEVLLVIEGLATEMNGPEIQRELDLTQNQYETIMTRLRRGIHRKEGWEP